MAIKISAPSSFEFVTGVREMSIHGNQYNWVGNVASPLIEVTFNDGSKSNYLAASIAVACNVGRTLADIRSLHSTIKYGPGGRRVYALIDEKIVDTILDRHDTSGSPLGRQERNSEICDFAYALIDLI